MTRDELSNRLKRHVHRGVEWLWIETIVAESEQAEKDILAAFDALTADLAREASETAARIDEKKKKKQQKLRDYFAGCALQGMLSRQMWRDADKTEIVGWQDKIKYSWNMADAMLSERGGK